MSEEELKKKIQESYNKYVITNDNVNLYKLENDNYVESGSISKDQKLELKEIEITKDTKFFPILSLDGYYINYKDVSKIEALDEIDSRYKRYVPFNENVETNDNINFYDKDNNLLFNLKESFNLPVIIKDDNKYGVEFNNRLLYINSSDVKRIYVNSNTSESNLGSIPILNYHFFYDEDSAESRRNCNQDICLSVQKLRSHLELFKNNNIFTPTLNELEMYLDGKLQLPRSVVLTIDDGWLIQDALPLFEEYQMNATVFLITAWYVPGSYAYNPKYVEFHSHGNDIHNPGVCPGGQGGGIKCLDKDILLKDLAESRSKLNNTTYFCYPFFEYNNYAIEVLKESGFTMAFIGGMRKASPGVNKFLVPRYELNKTVVAEDLLPIL